MGLAAFGFVAGIAFQRERDADADSDVDADNDADADSDAGSSPEGRDGTSSD